jgi:hypothetical protein
MPRNCRTDIAPHRIIYPIHNSQKNISLITTENILFFILVIVLLVPVWSVQYFPSQDGPVHRWLIYIIGNYNDINHAILREFLVRNQMLEPNMGFYLITYPISWFFNIYVAEKIFLSIYAFLFAYGVRYAIFSINKKATVLSFLVLPTIFSYYIHFGFYNFQLGIALFFPSVAYSILTLKNRNSRTYWKIGAISITLAIVHLVPFMIYSVVLGIFFVVYHTIISFKENNNIRYLLLPTKKGAVLTFWMIPSILVFLSFAQRHGVSESDKASPAHLLEELIKLRFTQSFSTFETMFISFPLFLVFATTIAILSVKILRYSKNDKIPVAILAATVGLGFLYLFFPFSSKEVSLNPRLVPLLFLLAIMVMSFVTVDRINRLFIISAVFLIVCVQAVFHLEVYQAYSSRLKSLDSVQAVMRDSSTFLNLTFTDDNQVEIRGNPLHHTRHLYPMVHAGANAAIDRGSIFMRASLMSPKIYGFFPYTYREHMDPFQVYGEIESLNPTIDIDAFEAVTGKPIDYIVVTGLFSDIESAMASGKRSTFEGIVRSYNHVASSADGWYHVYALRQNQFNDKP